MGDALPPAGYRPVSVTDTVRANRRWWDGAAAGYLAEHGAFLGSDRFLWCPEGLDEADAGLLGDVRNRRVLEVGCGAGQCSRWVAAQGGRAVGIDLSASMLRAGLALGALPLLQADARRPPFSDGSFDLAFSAYGAVPFVADPEVIMTEVARVLRPGGRWVFAVTHPIRWAFLDDPGEAGLTAVRSYFDRTPYIEAERGQLEYAEHHRTLGDRVRDIVRADLRLDALIEPEWPEGHERTWGGWSPLRGRLLPGTAIFVTVKP